MDFPELIVDPRDRDVLAAQLIALRNVLPSTGSALSPWVGGRAEGLRRLRGFRPAGYAGGRSIVGDDTGASTLGPWIRHGLISLGECREHALRTAGRQIPVKFLQELAWREYFQRVRADRGDAALWSEIEPPKVALGDAPLPDDIRFGRTGLACIDDNILRLRTTGYVVNQARMWLASYVTHHRRVRWQEGAAWFLQHLLDGDPPSNNLSWQWVASSFSHQPYLFSRGNVERFSTLCSTCPKARRGCPFDESKEARLERLRALPMADTPYDTAPSSAPRPEPLPRAPENRNPTILWIHGDHISAPTNPLWARYPNVPAVFLLDTVLARRQRISIKRWGFLAEGFSEAARAHPAGGRILVGDPVECIASAAGAEGVVATTATLGDRFREIVDGLRDREHEPIQVPASGRLVSGEGPVPPRFTRWWTQVEGEVLGRPALF